MLKKTQNKITIILIMIGTVLISLTGFMYIRNISDITSTQDIISVTKNYLIISVIIFVCITIIISKIFKKIIKKSMVEIVKDAGKIVTGRESKVRMLQEGNKTRDEFMSAFEDATLEIREHLKEVDKQKRQIETILLYMTDGIIAFNLEGEVTHKNLAAERLLNLSEEDNNFEKVFSKFNVDINLEKIVYLEDWTSSDKRINVGEKYINLLFVPYKDNNKRPAGVIAVIQDITEHVKLDNMRKEFVADVSHELKTPLTSILGYAETLSETDYDEEIRQKFLGVISSEAVRMTKLVNDLLTLSKFDNKKTEWERTEFDLGELVKQCQQNLQIEMEKKHQKVECFVTANVPNVYADRDGIERVVLNILSNSIKYTGEGGTIKIYVGFVYNDAYIKVIDNGIGIPEEDLNKIFERFYRVDKARTRQMGGTGLRTFNCKRNIRPK